MARGGLGRGLAAILPEQDGSGQELIDVPVGAVSPNPGQPRTRFDQDSLAELALSIEAAGVVQPLLVRELPAGRYELIAGERRWRAAQIAGLETVPAIVRNDTEPERLQIALLENVAREDLNAVDAARACAALVEDLGVSREELGKRLGRSRSAVSNLIRLLDLPDEALELISSGELSEGHGRAILAAPGHDQRRRLARKAVVEGWSVRQTEDRARNPGETRTNVTAHPDQQAAAARATEALEAALGREVSVRITKRGISARLAFSDLDDLHEFTRSRG